MIPCGSSFPPVEEFFDGVSAREHREAATKTIRYFSIFNPIRPSDES